MLTRANVPEYFLTNNPFKFKFSVFTCTTFILYKIGKQIEILSVRRYANDKKLVKSRFKLNPNINYSIEDHALNCFCLLGAGFIIQKPIFCPVNNSGQNYIIINNNIVT